MPGDFQASVVRRACERRLRFSSKPSRFSDFHEAREVLLQLLEDAASAGLPAQNTLLRNVVSGKPVIRWAFGSSDRKVA